MVKHPLTPHCSKEWHVSAFCNLLERNEDQWQLSLTEHPYQRQNQKFLKAAVEVSCGKKSRNEACSQENAADDPCCKATAHTLCPSCPGLNTHCAHLYLHTPCYLYLCSSLLIMTTWGIFLREKKKVLSLGYAFPNPWHRPQQALIANKVQNK